MAQVFRAANLARELEYEDIRVLMGIELGMRRFQFVPMDQISFFARVNKSETEFRLNKLHKLGILQRNSQLGYVGYQLISESYDVLAFHTLVRQNVIVAVGDVLGRGKESDVYFAQLPTGEECALKIHRIGQTSFRKIRKLRNYIQGRRHISWLYVSRLSAESEFAALQNIDALNLHTPKPLGQNRHMVVMSLIDGIEISLIPHLEDPQVILYKILEQVEVLFLQGKIIHCDLGEFNILITESAEVRIIDWPQWESADHPNALSYLARDLTNINDYFQKNYHIGFDLDKMLDRLFGPDRGELEKY
ncbi:MAG: serine/threonine protein phosphatase [Promethearchaeota archaeon]|nr:MAG: serine/threonine protein phosphatase [Candidatus Lokiarchaeota archaeon]